MHLKQEILKESYENYDETHLMRCLTHLYFSSTTIHISIFGIKLITEATDFPSYLRKKTFFILMMIIENLLSFIKQRAVL